MNAEAWFFLFVIVVAIPGWIGLLVARNHPEGARRLVNAVKTFLFSRSGAWGTYIRISNELRSLGWWALVPGLFALATLAWRAFNVQRASRGFPSERSLSWLSMHVGLPSSKLEWTALGRVFHAGQAMDDAILAPRYSPAGEGRCWPSSSAPSRSSSTR